VAAGTSIHFWQGQLVAGTQPGPIIATAGSTAAVGADALQAACNLADEDFFLFGTVNIPSTTTTSYLTEFGSGTNNDRMVLYATSGALTCFVSAGGVNISPAATHASGNGRVAIGLRRRGGKFTFAAKNVAGTVLVQAEGAAVAMPAASKVFVGSSNGSGAQPNGAVEGLFVRRGTFSDADLSALLAAA
jgi:hypothetical protein